MLPEKKTQLPVLLFALPVAENVAALTSMLCKLLQLSCFIWLFAFIEGF